MSSHDPGAYPQYPNPPPGASRLEHIPTVEACIRYWASVEEAAAKMKSKALLRTAGGLKKSFESIRDELAKAANTAKPTRRKKR